MSRGDLLSKIGRDIVLIWILSFALLSFHAITKRAHYDRLVVSGSFNAISIARALAVVPEGTELTVDELYHWYQEASFGNLFDIETPMPDGLNLGPLDLSYLVRDCLNYRFGFADFGSGAV